MNAARKGLRLGGIALSLVCGSVALTLHAPIVPLPIEQGLSFLPQLLVVSGALAVVYGILRQWFSFALHLAASLTFGFTLLPIYQEAPPPVRGSGEPFTLVHANILYGNTHGNRIVDFLQKERPVVAFLVELDEGTRKAIEPLKDLYPYRVSADGEMPKHIELLSQVPFQRDTVRYLLDPLRPIVDVTIEVNGKPLRVVAIHVVAPVSFEKFELRNIQLQQIAEYLNEIKEPYVAIGDFNTTMWSPAYHAFLAETGLKNMRQGRGIFPSWYLIDPKWWLLGTPIDQGFTKGDFEVVDFQLGPDVGSDHLPLIMKLRAGSSETAHP